MASPPSSDVEEKLECFEAKLGSDMREIRELLATMKSKLDKLIAPPSPLHNKKDRVFCKNYTHHRL
jgi:hypothetical protein